MPSEADRKAASEAWLRDFCERSDCPSYETVMAALDGKWPTGSNGEDDWCSFQHEGDYLFFSGIDAHSEIPPEFWVHYEVVTGNKVPTSMRATGFSCSC